MMLLSSASVLLVVFGSSQHSSALATSIALLGFDVTRSKAKPVATSVAATSVKLISVERVFISISFGWPDHSGLHACYPLASTADVPTSTKWSNTVERLDDLISRGKRPAAGLDDQAALWRRRKGVH